MNIPSLPPQVGPWELGALIATGGMGIVVRGVHQQTQQIAAVKILLWGRSDAKTRFAREVNALLKLGEHPNLVRIFDVGMLHDESGGWIAMELLQGEPLPRRLSEYQVLNFICDVGAGLAHAHAHGVAHRDVKPGNVIRTAQGYVLIDFGIAEHQGQEPITVHGGFAGTIVYSPPEMWRESSRVNGMMWDIYALGQLAYELATGEYAVPQVYSNQGWAKVVMLKARSLALRLPEEYSDGLVEVIRWATEPDPTQRAPSMEALVSAAGDAMLELNTVDEPPPSRRERIATYESNRTVVMRSVQVPNLDQDPALEVTFAAVAAPSAEFPGADRRDASLLSEGPTEAAPAASSKRLVRRFEPTSWSVPSGELTTAAMRRHPAEHVVMVSSRALADVAESMGSEGSLRTLRSLPPVTPMPAQPPRMRPSQVVVAFWLAGTLIAFVSMVAVAVLLLAGQLKRIPKAQPAVAPPPAQAIAVRPPATPGDGTHVGVISDEALQAINLVASDGTEFVLPARVPEGQYTIVATFADQSANRSGRLVVTKGHSTSVWCVAKLRQCGEVTP